MPSLLLLVVPFLEAETRVTRHRPYINQLVSHLLCKQVNRSAVDIWLSNGSMPTDAQTSTISNWLGRTATKFGFYFLAISKIALTTSGRGSFRQWEMGLAPAHGKKGEGEKAKPVKTNQPYYIAPLFFYFSLSFWNNNCRPSQSPWNLISNLLTPSLLVFRQEGSQKAACKDLLCPNLLRIWAMNKVETSQDSWSSSHQLRNRSADMHTRTSPR